MKLNWKAIGIIASVAGGVLSLLSSIADEKKMEETVDEKVRLALEEREEEEESE